MNGPEAIQAAVRSSQNLVLMYLNDLSDADLLVRPTPQANHIAWQFGHLIASEAGIAKGDLHNATYPTLPQGFVEQHSKVIAAQEPPRGFSTKAQYIELFNATRQASLDAIGKLTEKDLDAPTSGQMKDFAPTLGNLLLLIANHDLMHAGQFTVVRRKLGKPVIF